MRNQVAVSRSIYESFSTIFIVSRVNGICPLGVVRNVKGITLFRSKKIVACSYITISLLVCSSVYGLIQNYKIKEVHNIRLRTVAGIVCTLSENVFLLFSCVLSTLLAPFWQHHFLKCLECLNQVDILLVTKNLHSNKKCSKVTVIALTIIVIILVLDIILWSGIATKNTPLVIYLLRTIPLYLTYICQMTVELHFWMLVNLVKVRLVCLNQELLELLREVDVWDSSFKNESRRLVKVVGRSDRLKINEDRVRTVRSEKIGKQVKNFINIHHLLVEAVSATNSYFGVNVVVLLIGCLMHLLITPYVLYLQIKETKNLIFVGSQLMWLICHISKLMFIVEPCQACKSQVQFTISAVCKLLRFEICKEAKLQLQTLLVQLDTCKIQFTACSLVTIDRTLLSTVTGTVTTYLVILFQFK